MTIREIIDEKLKELRDIDSLGPVKASELIVELSSLLASINKEVADREWVVNILKMKYLAETGVVGQATIKTNASQEYKEWKEALAYQKAVLDNIRSLKYYLRRAENETQEGRY
jgi:hypothetical protein